MVERTCSVGDCSGQVIARGLCWKHYQRMRRHGTTDATEREPVPLAVRLARHVAVRSDTGCWEWEAYRSPAGYGRIQVSGKCEYTHRVAYRLFIGPIPDGLHLDHLCRNPACCNPMHLEPVTSAENSRRSPITNMNRTHCPSGHPYDDANTYHYRGRRYCKACQRRHFREWKNRQAANA